MTQVPNIKDTIKYIQDNNKAMEAIVKGAASTMISISEETEGANLKKATKNMRYIYSGMISYMDIISNIISELSKPYDNSKDLMQLLGYTEFDGEGKKLIKPQYKTIEALQQISTVMKDVVSFMFELSKQDLGFKAQKNIMKNIEMLKFALMDLTKFIIDEFSQIITKDNAYDIITLMMGSPGSVVKELHEIDDSNKTNPEKDNEKLRKRLEKRETEIQRGKKFGLLEVITSSLNIISQLNNIQIAGPLKFRLKLYTLKKQLTLVFKSLSQMWTEISKDKSVFSFISFMNKDDNNLFDAMMNVGMILDIVIKHGKLKNLLSIQIAIWAYSLFNEALTRLANMITDDLGAFAKLSDKSLTNRIENVKNNINIISDIFKTISLLGLIAIPMLSLGLLIFPALWLMEGIIKVMINVLNRINLPNTDKIFKNLNELNELIDELINVSKKIVIFSLLSPFILLAAISASLGVLGIIAFVTVVSWLTKLINKNITIDIVSSIKNISIILSSFIIIGLEMIAFALMKDIILLSIIAATIAITAIIAFTLVVATEFWLISKIMPTMKLNMMSFGMLIGLIAMTLITASLTLLLMSLIASQVISKVGVIFGLIGVITAVLIAISILGYTATFVAPALLGLLGITVAITCIFSIVLMLRILEEIKLDQESIINNVDSVFDTVTVILGRLFKRKKVEKKGDTDGDPRNDALKHGPMSGIFTVVKSLLGCVTLFMTLISVTSILIIAAQLRILQTLNLDSKTIIDNVDSVFKTSTYIIENLFYRKEDNSQPSNKPFIWKVISWIGGPIANIAEAIMAVAFLATTILAVGMIQILALQLKGISNTNIPNDIDEKVSSIITSAKKLIERVLSPVDDAPEASDKQKKGLRGVISNIFPNLSGMIDALTTSGILATSLISVGLISCLANNLNNIASITFTANIIEDKTKTIIECANKVNELINSSTLTESSKNININKLIELNKELSKLTEIPDKNVINTEKILNNYTEFIEKVNTIKVENLEKTTKMFKQMSQFSDSINGNFDKLAESLNEKLMPVLEELKDIMSSVPDKLDNGFANTSRSIISTSQTPVSQSTMSQQVQMENPNISKEDLDRIVKTRLSEQTKMQSNSITSKIDELMELLSTGKIRVETV